MAYGNKSLGRLILSPAQRRITGGVDPRNWALRSASALLTEAGYDSGLVDLSRILPLRRVAASPTYDPGLPARGALVPRHGGFRIMLNAALRGRRRVGQQRFTIAHELGHTYFYNLDASTPRRLSGLDVPDKAEERLCDLFASELLVPSSDAPAITRVLEGTNSSPIAFLRSFAGLALKYQVSHFTLAIRLIHELGIWTGVVFCVTKTSKYWLPTADTSTPPIVPTDQAWRLLWSVASGHLGGHLFIPNPKGNQGPFPKLRWPGLESVLDSLEPLQELEFCLPPQELGAIGNLRSYVASRAPASALITIAVVSPTPRQHLLFPETIHPLHLPFSSPRSALVALIPIPVP